MPVRMDDFPAPSFHRAQRTAVRRNDWHGYAEIAVQALSCGFPDDANGFVYLVYADLHPVPNVSRLINRDTE